LIRTRIKKLTEELLRNNIKGLIVTKPENIYYLTGFSGEGLALITDQKNYIITDFRYVEQAKNQTSGLEIVETKRGASHFLIAYELINDLGLKSIGIESRSLSIKEFDELEAIFKNVTLIKTDGFVEELRIIKDADEIYFIKAAQQITDKAFEHILGYIKPEVSELDLVAELEYFMKKSGSKNTAFETILISGPKTSLPHGVPSERKLQQNDFVTIDFGARFNGYCSDMTRTVIIGKPSKEQLSIYNIVLDAQVRALEMIKPGLKGKEVDDVARKYISDHGYGKNFGHGLGHGVGLEIHEDPRLSPNSEKVLLPGMVVTVEPGIYIENFGGVRIEDMIVLTEKGYENLTHSEKHLICL